jgi:dipeptidyl aminopeptidase/acylaminoacyl peptidase
MKNDGSEVSRLTITYGASYPQWSPDGTRIAFVSKDSSDDKFGIYVMDVSGLVGIPTSIITAPLITKFVGKIGGTASANAQVILYRALEGTNSNDELLSPEGKIGETIADEQGKWQVSGVTLIQGVNRFVAVVVQNDQSSLPSNVVRLEFQVKQPAGPPRASSYKPSA